MSRIGKMPVTVPSGVEVTIKDQNVVVKGARGTLVRDFPQEVKIEQNGNLLNVIPVSSSRATPALWGLARSLLSNMVVGVSKGFTKTLQINGVGYRAAVNGSTMKLVLGFSHEIDYPIPDGLKVSVDKNTIVTVEGADKELLGSMCADLRSYRPPEPYKGKGVRYAGEYVIQKVGKKK